MSSFGPLSTSRKKIQPSLVSRAASFFGAQCSTHYLLPQLQDLFWCAEGITSAAAYPVIIDSYIIDRPPDIDLGPYFWADNAERKKNHWTWNKTGLSSNPAFSQIPLNSLTQVIHSLRSDMQNQKLGNWLLGKLWGRIWLLITSTVLPPPSLPKFLQNIRFSFLLLYTPQSTANKNSLPSEELALSPANFQHGY